jgi:outer membrane protein OmpA-like peptidoglycan-associated protein
VGTSSSAFNFVVTNDGNEALNITGISKALTTGCSHFSAPTFTDIVDPPPPGTDFSNVAVTFSPTSLGLKSCDITITTDDPDSPNTVVTVTGTGTGSRLSVSAGPVVYSDQRIGTSSSSQTFTISNTGTVYDLDVSGISILPADNDEDWIITPPGDLTLSPGESQLVTVVFHPVATGNQDATIDITSSNADLGAARTIDVQGNGIHAEMQLSPKPRNWPAVVVGQSVSRTVTIDNIGAADLTVDGISLSGTDASQFSITSAVPLPNIVIAGSSGSAVDIDCTPSSVGPKTASLDVTSDADTNANDSVTLNCTGFKPDITTSPANGGSINFANTDVGQTSSPSQVTISNANDTYTSTLNVSNVTITGTNAGDFSHNAADPYAIAKNGSEMFNVTFSPSDMGTRTATLNIFSDDQETPTVSITLTGDGYRPEIDVTAPTNIPPTLDFGNVVVDTTSSAQTVTVQNNGNKNLTISAVSLIGADSNQFSIASGPVPGADVIVAPAATETWTVDCTPTTTGAKSASLRITSDDANEGNLDIALDCNGIQSDLRVTPSPVSFPDTRVCEISNNVNVTLNNQGSAPVTITNTSVIGSQFAIVSGPGMSTLNAGQSTQMTLNFSPTAMTTVNGTLRIESSDPSSPLDVGLTGIGRLASASVDMASISFGNVRTDSTPPQQIVTVTNTGDASWQLTSLSNTDTVNFDVSPVSPASLPTTLAPSETATFAVIAQPMTMGAKSTTITLMTDIPSAPCGMAPIQIPVSATGVTPGIDVDPTSVAFGDVDVDVGQTTRNVTITNTGTTGLEITDVAICTTGSNCINPARFAVVGGTTPPFTIPVSSSSVVVVGYDPNMEALGGAEDKAVLEITADAPGGDIQVVLTGSGTDRHIAVNPTGTIDLGTVFRYPDTPATQTVTVSNTGKAPLDVSMVVETDTSDVFEISAANLNVPGEDSRDLTVTFDPKASGTFRGTVTLINNDDGDPMHRFNIEGIGVTPNVITSPNEPIDLGVTGVNIPIERQISVVNMETVPFRVATVQAVAAMGAPAESADYFTITGIAADAQIDGSASLPFNVAFVADKPGVFEVEVQVYLNDDPDEVAVVRVKGEAVEVKVRGGGCSVDGTDGRDNAATVVLVLILGLLMGPLLARSRSRARVRRGPSRRRRRGPGSWMVLLIGAGALIASDAANAEPTRNLDIANFTPMPSTEGDMFSVESPLVGPAGAWAIGLTVNHATNPLKVESPQREGMSDKPITGRTGAQLGFSYAFGGKYEAGALVSMIQQSGNDPLFSGLESAEGSGLGDMALHAKAHLLDAGKLSLATSATLTLPTGSNDMFAGIDGPSMRARGIFGLNGHRLHLAANGGVRLRGSGTLGDLQQGNELTYGFAAAFRIQDKLSAVGELSGALGISGGESTGVSPLEASAGVRYRLTRQIGVASGFGRGIMPGIGAPDFRAFLLVSYAPKGRAIEPIHVPPPPKVIDRGDDDGDGIINEYDKCPKEAEDKDGHDDKDGCPDPDNDNDGIADKDDKCPNKAEDKDGFQDKDGCPDTDNDKDGIPDVKDQCPNEAEDKDGFQDDDGCDDPDNDKDGIPDVIDQCATQPETINGKQDDDGCPDTGDSLVMVMPDRIEVFEPVRFVGNTARINKKSKNVLGQVAATLRANRDFVRIRIGVHVHPRNRGDLALTTKRAKAVRKWLISWGILPERLEAKGYGSTRLLVPKRKRGAKKVNDRVEFVILEKRVQKRGKRKKK